MSLHPIPLCLIVSFSVHQMTILESESTGEGTPQGVVLALVSSEADSSRDQEHHRMLRMYNLASLVSLAKWTITQRVSTCIAFSPQCSDISVRARVLAVH